MASSSTLSRQRNPRDKQPKVYHQYEGRSNKLNKFAVIRRALVRHYLDFQRGGMRALQRILLYNLDSRKISQDVRRSRLDRSCRREQ